MYLQKSLFVFPEEQVVKGPVIVLYTPLTLIPTELVLCALYYTSVLCFKFFNKKVMLQYSGQ